MSPDSSSPTTTASTDTSYSAEIKAANFLKNYPNTPAFDEKDPSKAYYDLALCFEYGIEGFKLDKHQAEKYYIRAVTACINDEDKFSRLVTLGNFYYVYDQPEKALVVRNEAKKLQEEPSLCRSITPLAEKVVPTGIAIDSILSSYQDVSASATATAKISTATTTASASSTSNSIHSAAAVSSDSVSPGSSSQTSAIAPSTSSSIPATSSVPLPFFSATSSGQTPASTNAAPVPSSSSAQESATASPTAADTSSRQHPETPPPELV